MKDLALSLYQRQVLTELNKTLETEIIYYKSEKIRKPHNIFATRKNMRINKLIQLRHGKIELIQELLK